MSNNHVPAWKRLGLKLKYANEDSSTTEGSPQVHEKGQKRKHNSVLNDSGNSIPSAKKIRTNDDVSNSKTPDTPSKVTSAAGKTTLEDTATPNLSELRRKKSVSFSADTKDDDGDTAQNVPVTVPGSPGSTPRKPKREKKSKADRQSSASQLPRKSVDALDYLNQHFHDRGTWKFNKNRETWILKHALSTDVIPSDHNAQLAGYIHGLKSTGARSRLVKDCQEALSKVEPKVDDGNFRLRFTKDLENDSLHQSQQEDPSYSSWIQNETRPALILLSLGQSLTDAPRQINGMKQDAAQANGLPIQRVKKSKARTSRIEIESESDSSSSDSDDSSDSSDDEAEDETSSSGSSASDSNSASSSDEDTSSSGSSSESDSEPKPKTNGKGHVSNSDDSGSDSE